MTAYFGTAREAKGWQEMDRTLTPVGERCSWCSEPIHGDDDGVIGDNHDVWHADCWLVQVLRKVRSDAGEEPGVPRRQAATQVVQAFEQEGRL